jgi:hypothetical protein
MFEWLIPLLLVALLLIWILDLPEIVGDALGSLVLAAIVGTVKLTAFLIRKLVTALSSDPRSPFPAKPRQEDKA